MRDRIPQGVPSARLMRKVAKKGILLTFYHPDFTCGFFDGGCLVFAKALVRTFGGELVQLVSPGGQTEHYGARISNVIYDAGGAYKTGEEWAKWFHKHELRPTDRVPTFMPVTASIDWGKSNLEIERILEQMFLWQW